MLKIMILAALTAATDKAPEVPTEQFCGAYADIAGAISSTRYERDRGDWFAMLVEGGVPSKIAEEIVGFAYDTNPPEEARGEAYNACIGERT